MSGSTTWPAGIPTPTDPRISAALARWVDAAEPENPAGALAAIVGRVAAASRLDVALVIDGRSVAPSATVEAVDVDADVLVAAGPWLPGFAREALLSADERRSGGVHHTTPRMAAALVGFVAGLRRFRERDTIFDPAVGGGVFLLAVGEAMGGDRAERLEQMCGFDIDPLAAATAEASLRIWADGAPLPENTIRVADALEEPWPAVPSVVVGNPPFRSQLRDGTGRSAARRTELHRRWPELRGYVDDAAAFLLAGVEHVADGGVVALVQPSSFLSARDAEGVRRRLEREAPPVGLWIDGGRRFAASVDTATIVVRKGAVAGPVRRARGVPAEPLPACPPTTSDSWASLLLVDTPPADGLVIASSGVLGDVANVTAGFRDQFYGLRGAVAEAVDGQPRLITSGLIDPLTCRWGETSCRFDKRTWRAPTVDPAAVDPDIRTWVADRLVPKLVVASQTKVLEVAIDAAGEMVPCTPVITVEPSDGAPSLAHLAAALTSPLASLLLMQKAAGSALSAEAMRVSARALAGLPLPAAGEAWDRAAAAVAALDGPPILSDLAEIGRLALAAHGLGERDDILNWWQTRLRGR
jgi:hypothetical protein